ncbi:MULTISPECIES: hypothetical protein [Halomonadaceae]|uniref:hypothetical protein n=1 Tax=Halomonadaceae TaxID=28256 RepID=UPI001E5A65B8|nr:hypothetical protein [Halomonas sp. MES3-P3E]
MAKISTRAMARPLPFLPLFPPLLFPPLLFPLPLFPPSLFPLPLPALPALPVAGFAAVEPEEALAVVLEGLGAAALGEAVLLPLAALEVVVGVASAGFAPACEVPGTAGFFSEALFEVLSEELVAVEPVFWDPFPRRRERLFLAPLLVDGVAELDGGDCVLGSVASVVEAALLVVVGTPWEASADVGCTSS